ncbi:MAG: DUF1207 domain-containing protein [Bacteroidetes bacterium]|nr:DUF1207 domain-containing protein [Bacteroidota bacterium]
MKIRIAIFLLFLISLSAVFAQEKEKAVEFLPFVHYFDPLILDPVECQSFGSLYAFWEGSQRQDIIYSPLALGFQLPVVQWDKGDHGFEIGFMATVFFQFEFVEPSSIFQVNLINTDFKTGIPFVYRYKRFALRMSLYHVSSHFSEEYIFRNEINGFGENKNTYDALDMQASWQFRKIRYYGGVGAAFNSPHKRGTWKFQAGFLFRSPVKEGSKFNYIAGADFQVLEETKFSLNSMLGAGIELNMNKSRTFQVMLQYFNGNLPYTQYTHLKVQYLGATLIGHPF